MADEKNLTEVVFILDRSGSMNNLKEDTIGGFNSMLDKQKNVDGRVLISTILFNDEIKVLHDRLPIEEINHITKEDYEPVGRTALLDAMGSTIKHIKTIHKYARDEDRPAKTLFIITTDGMENSSIKYSIGDVKKMVETQKEKGWEFLFLGANIDAIGTAGRFGISANRAVNYHADKIGTHAAFDMFGKVMSFASAAPNITLDEDQWDNLLSGLREDFKNRKRKG